MVNCNICLIDKDIKYGFKNGKKQFCKDCAKGIPNTCDLSRKMCKEDECKKNPYFNLEGQKKGIYCSTHKKPNMIDIYSPKCIEKDCKKNPYFNLEGQTKGIYCSIHKKPNMINVEAQNCIEKDCKSQPVFNFEGQIKGIYCSTHKKPNMINVVAQSCIEKDCKTQPNYNFEGETKRLYCLIHKKPNMINVVSPKCKNIQGEFTCDTQGNKKFDGYCLRCYIGLFPYQTIARNYKTKELKVCEYIKEQFSNLTISFDKIVKFGCSKRRPDIYIDMGSHSIIIEIDENQHDTYENICENKRFMEIFTDLGNRPMILIRFNPDEYYNDKNELVKSCWSFSKNGISIINRNKKDEWKNRLNKLKDSILFNIQNEPKKEIEITYLYYDEN